MEASLRKKLTLPGLALNMPSSLPITPLDTAGHCVSLIEKMLSSPSATGLQSLRKGGLPSPAYIVSDNEFHSEAWRFFYLKEHIQWQPANTYTPRQDGPSERAIRIVFERARALMLDAPHMPGIFWTDAVESATKITNLLPTSVPLYNSVLSGIPVDQGHSLNVRPSHYRYPEGAWFGLPADVNHFRKWGSPAWSHLHGTDKPKTKLDSRSVKCYIVGYQGHKVWRLWHPESNKIHVDRKSVV